jgi:hypothetical protein
VNKLWVFLAFALMAIPSFGQAGVYHSREEALKMAFPNQNDVNTVSLFLTPEQLTTVEKTSGIHLESPIQTFYVGHAGDRITGYAAIEAATVRTLPATVLVVLNPDGQVRFAEILAFFEPEEYRPSRRWLDQFSGQSLSPQLRIGGDIQGITGATLSAQALSRQIRKTVALGQILINKD